MRWECGEKLQVVQGIGTCEQKLPSPASVSVKIPPIEGRVVYATNQIKRTADFNYYPKEGFLFWKKRPIRDSWVDLDLGEIASDSGDWPVAFDVVGNHADLGVTVTRGVLYHRVCDDMRAPCSKLEYTFLCQGKETSVKAGEIGSCQRLSGTSQSLTVKIKTPNYSANVGARLYVTVPRLGIAKSIPIEEPELSRGEVVVDLPEIPIGPTLVAMRLSYYEGKSPRSFEGRSLFAGFSPNWTPLDEPHLVPDGDEVKVYPPVFSDFSEMVLFQGQDPVKRDFGSKKSFSSPKPKSNQVLCGFAWSREASDLHAACLDSSGKAVGVP